MYRFVLLYSQRRNATLKQITARPISIKETTRKQEVHDLFSLELEIRQTFRDWCTYSSTCRHILPLKFHTTVYIRCHTWPLTLDFYSRRRRLILLTGKTTDEMYLVMMTEFVNSTWSSYKEAFVFSTGLQEAVIQQRPVWYHYMYVHAFLVTQFFPNIVEIVSALWGIVPSWAWSPAITHTHVQHWEWASSFAASHRARHIWRLLTAPFEGWKESWKRWNFLQRRPVTACQSDPTYTLVWWKRGALEDHFRLVETIPLWTNIIVVETNVRMAYDAINELFGQGGWHWEGTKCVETMQAQLSILLRIDVDI